MLHVALTGGIGSGKSTVAALLVDFGAELIDADVLAREVVSPGTPALSAIAEAFGTTVADPARGLDRSALAEIVFADADARERLNSIVHPAVREAAVATRKEILARDPEAIIVEDIPLLAETGGAGGFHAVIVVHAPIALRVERLEQRGLASAQARARIDAQASDAERLEIADIVISNEASLTDLEAAVAEAWRTRLLPYRDALAGRGRAGGAAPGSRPGHVERAIARVRAACARSGAAPVTIAASGGNSEEGLLTVSMPAGPRPGEVLAAAGFIPAARGDEREFVSADPASRLTVRVVEDPL